MDEDVDKDAFRTHSSEKSQQNIVSSASLSHPRVNIQDGGVKTEEGRCWPKHHWGTGEPFFRLLLLYCPYCLPPLGGFGNRTLIQLANALKLTRHCSEFSMSLS